MKVIFNTHVPFSLAHGGAQIQIEQTKAALEKIGVEVEPLRWWDGHQSGQILHHFGRLSPNHIRLAQQQGLKVVISPFLSGMGARPPWMRFLQKVALRTIRPVAPPLLSETFAWDSYQLLDACIAMTEWEATLLVEMFATPSSRVHVVPNGVEDVFLQSEPEQRGQWLVCTAAIIELKQILKLADMAVAAQTPLWVIGKPHADSEDYARRFIDFARQHQNIIRYDGAVSDRQQLAAIYRQARGFVLLSRWESLSLSALEAAACGCPLLLSDLPWGRHAFREKASYCPHNSSVAASAPILRHFYDAAPRLEPPPKPLSWNEVAIQLRTIYENLR